MTNWNNENSFQKVLEAKERRERATAKKKKKTPKMDLGDTRAGQAAATGYFRKNEERRGPEHRGNWKIRTYKHSPGASKGRGKLGGIR